MVTKLKTTITQINEVSIIITQIIDNTFSSSSTGTSVSELISKILFITTSLSENKFDDKYEAAVTFVISVTEVSAISSEQISILLELKDLLSMFLVGFSGSLSDASQGLVGNKGLVVESIDTSLSFEEQAQAADEQLNTNRANCAGMDGAAKSLVLLLESDTVKIVCKDQFDDDCDDATDDSKSLLESTIELTKLSSNNIEDTAISAAASTIISMIESITIITFEQKNMFLSLIVTIKSTVLVYISQISLVESNKLKISGALSFPGAETTIDQVDENDFSQMVLVLEAQLTNLFQINNANDRVLECITTIEGLETPSDASSNKDLKKNIDEVPAMCSQPEPPVEEVQKTAADIASVCSSLTQQPTEAEVKSLLFIKKSLISFKQTFTSQITVFSQQLSAITGFTITEASLSVSIITATGEIGVAQEVDVTGGHTIGTIEFYTLRFETMMSALNSMELVFQKLTLVSSINEDGNEEDASIKPIDFALLILEFSSHLSSGTITSEILTISQNILKAKVTAAPSGAVLMLLQSLSLTISSQQMTLLSEVVTIKQSLIQVLFSYGQTLSDLTFVFKSFDETGEIVEISEAGGIAEASSSQLLSSFNVLQTSQSMFQNIMMILTATISFDYGSLQVEPSVEISMEGFMEEIYAFTLLMGKNPADPEIIVIGERIMTYKLSFQASSVVISQMEFIFTTVQSFVIQITTEMLSLQSQLGTINSASLTCSEALETTSQLDTFKQIFEDASEAFLLAGNSSSTDALISATDFSDDAIDFYLLLSSLDTATPFDTQGDFSVLFNKIVTQSNEGIMEASGKMKNVYNLIIESVSLITRGIQSDLEFYEDCAGIINKYKLLKSNEDAVLKMILTIEMLQNGTNFDSLEASSSCPQSFPVTQVDFQIPDCSGSSNASADIIVTLTSGLMSSLKKSTEEPSIFSLVETVVDAIFKYKFSINIEQSSQLATFKSELTSYLTKFESNLMNVTKKANESDIDLTSIEYKVILIPPCPPLPKDPLEELTLTLTGLLSNLYSLEASVTAIETVIGGSSGERSVGVSDFIASLDTLKTLVNLFNPCELHLTIIQELSAVLVYFSSLNMTLSSAQLVYLQSILLEFQQFILNIVLQINIYQGYFLEFTGAIMDTTTLNILTICGDGSLCQLNEETSVIGPILPSDIEANVSFTIGILNQLVVKIEYILLLIVQMISSDASLIVSTSTYTCSDLFSLLMKFISLLIKGQFGQELLDVADAILQITAISAPCEADIMVFIQMIFTILTEQNINIISTLVSLTQTLITFQGFILSINFAELSLLSLEDQTLAFDTSLEINRINCAGMDAVALELDTFLETVQCLPETEENTDITDIINNLSKLSKIAAVSLENDTIAQVSENLLNSFSILSSLTSVNSNQCKAIERFTVIIQNTVLVYVSQISILEQRRLLLGGQLNFSFSISSVGVDQEDFQKLTEIDQSQLSGLMQCGDFTDRTRLSIEASIDAEPNIENTCTSKEITKAARRVTAMCSSPVLPVEEVEATTKELARCSSNLQRPLSLREKQQMEFIFISLNAFRITFTSQITIVQQRLTFLTGQSLSASSLNISFINEFGESVPALPLDIADGDENLIPVTSIEVTVNPATSLGMELYLVRLWTEYRFAFSTMQIVLTSIQSVLDITCTDCCGVGPGDGTDFFTAVNLYFTKIGQGLFLIDELFQLTASIISSAADVCIQISYGFMLQLESIMISLRNYQMACLSEFIVIQQKLIQIGKTYCL